MAASLSNLMSFVQVAGPALQKGKEVCAASFARLTHKEQRYLTELLDKVPPMAERITKAAAVMLSKNTLASLTPDLIIAYLQSALELLHNKKFADNLGKLAVHYSHFVIKSKHYYALGQYIRCLLSQMDDKYAHIFLLLVKILEAAVAIFKPNSRMALAVEKMRHKATKYVLTPILNEIGSKSINHAVKQIPVRGA
jgi:hypothetical protein